MEVYVIRHGQTVWNKQNLLQGSADIDLTEVGREVAGKLGEELEGIEFDRIYASPLVRAFETACLVRGHRNIPIIRDSRLEEIHFGVMEGHSYTEFFSEGNPQMSFFTDPKKYAAPEEGESFEQLIARTGEFYREVFLPACKECERIMVVAHGTSNKAFICNLLGTGVDQFWGEGLQENGTADIYVYDGNKWSKKPGQSSTVDSRWGQKAW